MFTEFILYHEPELRVRYGEPVRVQNCTLYGRRTGALQNGCDPVGTGASGSAPSRARKLERYPATNASCIATNSFKADGFAAA
jgi:hypothetical protein